MLTNKLRRVDGNNDDVPPLFGDTDRTHMDESGISSVIGGVLQTAVLQDKARRLMRRYSALSRSFSACENHIVHLSKKNSMLDKFSSWKFAAAMNAESSRKEEENAVLSRFTESITALLRDLHSMRGCSVDQLIGAIQSRVQDVFCDDHVAVEMVGEPSRYVPSPMSRISTPSKSGQRDVSKSELIREIYGVKIVGNVAVEADSVKYILNQIPVDAETLRPLIGQEISVSFTEDQLRNWDYEMRKLHIRVKISRLSLVDRGQLLDSPFSALEEKLMASLCDTVGEALLLESPLSVAQMAVAVVRSVLGQLPPRVSLHRPPLEQECAPSAMQVRSPAPLREVSQTYSDTYSSSFASGTSLSSSFSSSSSESSDSSSSTSIGPDQPPLSPRKRSILPESHTLADTMASAPLQPDPQIVYLLSEPELVKISDELGDELISCLLQVLPALFGGISSDVSSERGTHVARDLCYSLSLCLKRISKGDIALLHILSNGAARNQDTTDHGYISSEDTSANDIFSNLAMSSEENCLHQFVRDEISKRKPNADEECVEGVNGGNMQFQLLDGLHGQGALGEVKIITAAHENARKQQKGFASLTYKEDDLNSVRRKQGVAIICYLISLSLAIPLKLQEMSNLVVGSKQQVTVLEESLTVATKLLMAEKNLTEGLRGKLSAMMALIVLVEKITKMPTLDDLARVVAEGLPTVLGVESAVLLLPPSTVAKCTYCAEGTQGIFSEAWAASAALPGTEDLVAVTGMNTGSEHSGGMHVTWKQVRQVPLFSSAAVGSVAQSHIPLSTPNAAPKVSAGVFNYGALLLFSPQKGDAPQSLAGSWVGLEDYLISSISAAIFGVLSDFRNMSTIAGYSSGMATLEQLRGKNIEYQEVVSGLRDAHEAAAQHMNEKDDQINSLRIEIESAGENYNANLKELSTILSEVDKKSIAMQQEAESSIFQLRQEQAELSALLHLEQSDHSALRSLVQSFVSFPGSNSDIAGTERWALTWLQDFAHAQGYALGTVQRGYGSDLTLTLLNMPLSNQKVIREDSPDYAAIRSTVISASVEALRCRDIVECSIDQHGGRTTGNTDVGLSVTIRSPLSDQGSKYSAVCIPNRYGSDGNTAYASFVFLKVEDSIKEVVSNEVQSGKELIMWASNLAGRVLCGQEMIGGGMSSLGAENKLLRCAIMQKETLEVMLNTAVTMVSELWLRNISTTGDVCKALETYSALLLTPMHSENREGKDDIDCNVVAEVILVKKKKSKDSAVRKVVQSGRTLRAGMALYLPIASRVSEKGSLVGVLCIERKPTGFREDRDTEGPSKTTADNRISSLAISQDEETALKLLCALSVPSFERIALVSDTYNGITQASRAMEALQDMHEELRNKLADEITSKYLLQDVLKQSTATLNAMITRGYIISTPYSFSVYADVIAAIF